MQNEREIPDGYVQNAAGHLVPKENMSEQDLLRDDVATTLALAAVEIHKLLTDFKAQALSDIQGLVEIAGDRYGVSMGGKKGNVTITTFNGKYRVQRIFSDRIEFTEQLEVAKELVFKCINSWSQGANPNLVNIVNRAFLTDSKGQVRTARVLDMLHWKNEDSLWVKAMEAVRDSIAVTGSAVYVRVYVRNDKTNEYDPLPLDIAKV